MIPYDDIIATADRSWSLRLIERMQMPAVSAAELQQLAEALTTCSDPRTVAPLTAILTTKQFPDTVRTLAGACLREFWDHVVEDDPILVRAWWESGDAVLQHHALLCMAADVCPDILRQVASTVGHPQRVAALGRMTFDFCSSDDQKLKLAALADVDPMVRAEAADQLLYDEPVTAQTALIAATADGDPRVVLNALNTLQYYPTCAVVRCLHPLLTHPHNDIRAQAQESWDALRNDLLCTCNRSTVRQVERLRQWLQPVWDLLAFTPADFEPNSTPYSPPPPPPGVTSVEVAQFLRLATRANTSPKTLSDLLYQYDWSKCTARQRLELRPILLHHADPAVRNRAAYFLAAWGDLDGVLQLTAAPHWHVGKAAIVNLLAFPPTADLAEVAWAHFSGTPVTSDCKTWRYNRRTWRGLCPAYGSLAQEALSAYVHHGNPAEVVPRLHALALDPEQTEYIRSDSIKHLVKLGARAEIARLMPLLHEPPIIDWSIPIALLDATRNPHLGLPRPDTRHLDDIDNLQVQLALADLSDGS